MVDVEALKELYIQFLHLGSGRAGYIGVLPMRASSVRSAIVCHRAAFRLEDFEVSGCTRLALGGLRSGESRWFDVLTRRTLGLVRSAGVDRIADV